LKHWKHPLISCIYNNFSTRIFSHWASGAVVRITSLQCAKQGSSPYTGITLSLEQKAMASQTSHACNMLQANVVLNILMFDNFDSRTTR
jgi:hypothetical protein